MSFCEGCGRKLDRPVVFCTVCGRPQRRDVAPARPTVQAPPAAEPSTKRRVDGRLLLAAGIGLAVVVVVGVGLVLRRADDETTPTGGSMRTSAPTTPRPPWECDSTEAGYAVTLPGTWKIDPEEESGCRSFRLPPRGGARFIATIKPRIGPFDRVVVEEGTTFEERTQVGGRDAIHYEGDYRDLEDTPFRAYGFVISDEGEAYAFVLIGDEGTTFDVTSRAELDEAVTTLRFM